ncbi:protein of unknown function [Marinobacter segnicrescens]|uniref:DUF4112 domain-containing protein n=1 Tax=Marinobacter segnicrescens TaxID=430453 RepID=A0A1I0GRD7_9GAMM|nr:MULTISPECIES: DUF4112 domain-containing protein [Marinobacter]UZD66758.1 DUF4112 domain-containing protein [Marinobacter sp. AN1]SET73939.1 protein of unknown function [Marinobacter segnicrescens]
MTRQRTQALRRVERFSRLMDSAIRIPGTRFSVGLDGLLGLVPVVGDMTGLLLSGYILVEAQRAGASRRARAHIVKNILLDAVVGSVPVLGDAFDFVYKANLRNARILREELGDPPGREAAAETDH